MNQATLELNRAYAPKTSMTRNNCYESSIEGALKFLVECFLDYGVTRNKNTIIHSLRVATYLQNIGASESAVIGGVLHDLLESCPKAFSEVDVRYGKKILALVSANTLNRSQNGWKARFKDSVARGLKSGDDAFLIRAADLLDNCWHFMSQEKEERLERCLWKLEHLLVLSEDLILTPVIKDMVVDLQKAHIAVKASLESY